MKNFNDEGENDHTSIVYKHYPVLSTYENTPMLYDYFVMLYEKERKFWTYLAENVENDIPCDILLYIHCYEEVRLPKWIFKVGDKYLQAGLRPELLYINMNPDKVTIMQNNNPKTKIVMETGLESTPSILSTIVKNLFPYLALITITTENSYNEIYMP